MPLPLFRTGKGRHGRGKRIACRMVVAFLLVLAACVSTFIVYTRPARLTPYAERLIADFSGADARVGSAHLDRRGALVLHDISFSIPGVEGTAGKILEIGQATIAPNIGRVLTGELGPSAIRDIVLNDTTFYLTEDLDAARYNYEHFLMRPDAPADGGDVAQTPAPEDTPAASPQKADRAWLRNLPGIALKRGRINFGTVEGGVYTPRDVVILDGALRGDKSESGVYQYELHENTPTQDDPTDLTGDFDLTRGDLYVKVENFNIDAPYRHVLPRSFRHWWDDLTPSGRFPLMELRVVGQGDGKRPLTSAELMIEDVAMALNIYKLDKSEYVPQMKGVSGVIKLANRKIHVDKLVGEVEDVRFEISGWHGMHASAPFDITAKTAPFRIEEQPEFLRAIGPFLRKYYDRFKPSGKYQIEARSTRAERGGEPTYNAMIHLLEGKASYDKFPYPLLDLTGKLEISHDRVDLHDLTCRGPGGGKIVIAGEIAPPRTGGVIDITIQATDGPLDQHLLDAMQEKQRKHIELFFHSGHYQRLIERGVIDTSDPKLSKLSPDTPAALSAPMFDLGGTVKRFDMRIHQELGPNPAFKNFYWSLDPVGMNILYGKWPYPAKVVSGFVENTPERITLTDGAFEGVTGGTIKIEGTLEKQGWGKPILPKLKVTEADLPLDPVLVSTIPEPQDRWVRMLHADGRLKATGDVFALPDGKAGFRFDGKISQGSLAPNNGHFPLTGVTGGLTIANDHVAIHELQGARGDSTLTANGKVTWGQGAPTMDFTFDAKDFQPTLDALDLIPPGVPIQQQVAELIETYQPSGRMDGQLRWRDDGETPGTFAATAQPRDLAFDYRDQRVKLTDMSGSVTATPDHLEFDGLAASFEHGNASLSGITSLAGDPTLNLTFGAKLHTRSPMLETVLPDNAMKALRGMRVRGPFEITTGSLVRDPEHSPDQGLAFTSLIKLDGMSAKAGVDLTDITGHLGLRINTPPNAAFPEITLTLAASELSAMDRRIAPLALNLESIADGRILKLTGLRGSVYGGTILGNGFIGVQDDSPYQFDLQIHDVELDPFMEPKKYKPTPQSPLPPVPTDQLILDTLHADAPLTVFPPLRPTDQQVPPVNRSDQSGRIAANLVVAGTLDDPASREGRGAVEITEATLFKRPVAFAVMQAANLGLPTSNSFDHASARYLLLGNTVFLDMLSLNAGNVSLRGDGTMKLPSTQIDLRMVTRYTDRPHFGVLTEAFNAVKDGLVAVHVTGTMDQPRANVAPLNKMHETWSSLFDATLGPHLPKTPPK